MLLDGVRSGRPRTLPDEAVERIRSEREAGASFANKRWWVPEGCHPSRCLAR